MVAPRHHLSFCLRSSCTRDSGEEQVERGEQADGGQQGMMNTSLGARLMSFCLRSSCTRDCEGGTGKEGVQGSDRGRGPGVAGWGRGTRDGEMWWTRGQGNTRQRALRGGQAWTEGTGKETCGTPIQGKQGWLGYQSAEKRRHGSCASVCAGAGHAGHARMRADRAAG